MIFTGLIFFCFLIFFILCLTIYSLIAGKKITANERQQLKKRALVLMGLGVLLLVASNGVGALALGPLSIIFSIIANSILLTLIFSKLEAVFKFSWLKIIYYIGVACVFMTSIQFQSYHYGYGLSAYLETTFIVASFVLGSSFVVVMFTVFVRLLLSIRDRRFSDTGQAMPVTNKDKIQHYYDEGLTESEVEYFRSQMAIARQQIKSVEDGIAKTAKLRAIEVRYNTIEVAQNFFKDIVEDPTRFTQASQFLYKFLPSLEDLILKYNEINAHVAKNKQTYLILEKSAQTIEQICEQITDEYVLFHQDTYNEMQDEIKLANRNLSRKAARQHMSSDKEDIDGMSDSVDAILKESNDWLADQDNE